MEKIKAIPTTYHVSIMYDGWVLMCVLEDLAFRNESDVCFVKKKLEHGHGSKCCRHGFC